MKNINIWVEPKMESHAPLYDYVQANFDGRMKEHGFLFGSFEGIKKANSEFNHYHSFDTLNQKYDIDFSYHQFLIAAKEMAFNNDGEFMPYSYFYANRSYYYAKHGREGKLFIRPNSGFKTIPSGVWDIEHDLDSQYRNICAENKTDELVYISSPKEIKMEGRFFIWDDKIVDSCVYAINGELISIHNTPHQAISLVESYIEKNQCKDRAYVIDAVMDANNKMKLLETNGYFTSGIYACEPAELVKPLVAIFENAKI